MIVAGPQSQRRHFWWIALPLIAYGVVVAGASILEERLVFKPILASEFWNDPSDPLIQDVWIVSAEGDLIHAWWLPPRDGADHSVEATLFCHGNAHNLSSREETLHRIRQATGGGVLIFDYPGFGKSEGLPSEASCTAAGEAAWQWLRMEQGISAPQILLYGESLGGGIAVELAYRHGGRALLLTGTFASLPAAAAYYYPWLPCQPLMRNRFANVEKLPKIHVPTIIVHGMADTVIPHSHALLLASAAAGPSLLLSIPDGEHDMAFPLEIDEKIISFLAQQVTQRTAP